MNRRTFIGAIAALAGAVGLGKRVGAKEPAPVTKHETLPAIPAWVYDIRAAMTRLRRKYPPTKMRRSYPALPFDMPDWDFEVRLHPDRMAEYARLLGCDPDAGPMALEGAPLVAQPWLCNWQPLDWMLILRGRGGEVRASVLNGRELEFIPDLK